jgi:ribose transport system ATP-binding protein
VPEDRKTEGLFLHLSGKANVSLPILDRLAKFGWIDGRAEAAAVDTIFAQLNGAAARTLPAGVLV